MIKGPKNFSLSGVKSAQCFSNNFLNYCHKNRGIYLLQQILGGKFFFFIFFSSDFFSL